MERMFKLGVDLDGCVADYVGFFRRSVSERLGVDPASLPDPSDWSFTEWGLGSREGFERMHRAAVMDDRMFARMDMIAGASEALWKLSDAEVHITVITHRLCVNWGHGTAAGDTVSWLDDKQIPYRDICFLADKPTLQADMYIDDAPHNIQALQHKWGEDSVIIFDTSYNRHCQGMRAANWDDVTDIVLGRLAGA